MNNFYFKSTKTVKNLLENGKVDSNKIKLLMNLGAYFETIDFPKLEIQTNNLEHFENEAFFDGYFSNLDFSDFQKRKT